MVIDETVYRPPFTQETSEAIKTRTECWPEAVTKFLTWGKKMVMHNDQRRGTPHLIWKGDGG